MAYDLTGDQTIRPARRRRAVLRPSGRQHGLLDSRQPADLDVAGSPQRPAPDAGHRSQHCRCPGADHLPVRREGAFVMAVAGRRADGAALGRRRSTSPMSAIDGFNRLRAFQGGGNGSVDLNAVDIGAAYLPQNQDPTLAPSSVPGATRVYDEPAAPVPRLAATSTSSRRSSGTSTTRSRRHSTVGSASGLAFGMNYTLGLSLKGNTGLQIRFAARGGRHHLAARGSGRVRKTEREPRPAAARHQEPMPYGNCRMRQRALGRVGGYLLNDWQISGVLTAGSANHVNNDQAGGRYDLTYNYQNNGTNMNLTGSPDYAARIVLRRRSRERLFGRPVQAVQCCRGHRAAVRQRRPRVGAQHSRRVPRQDGRPGDCRDTFASAATVLCSSVSMRSTRSTSSSFNNRQRNVTYRSPTDLTIRQLADAAGWVDRSGAAHASQRRVRRSHRRAEYA